MWNSNHNFPRFSILFSVSLYKQFLWENSRTWNISSQSWDTHVCAGWTQIRVHVQIAQKNMNHAPKKDVWRCKSHFLMFLIHKKYSQTSNCCFLFLSYGPSHFCPKTAKLGGFGTYLVNHEPKIDVFWLKSHCFKVLNPWNQDQHPQLALF